MYAVLLPIHSILRWIALAVVLAAVIKALAGWLWKKPWGATDNALGAAYPGIMDLQVLLGILLYFVFSPVTTAGLRNFSGAMSNPQVRFFLVEHLVVMLASVVLAHVGRSRVKKAAADVHKHRLTFIFFGFSLLAMLAGIPWERLF